MYQFMKKENAHECRVKFTLKSQLTIHVASVHEEKKAPQMCLMCYQFFNKKQLEQTHRLHTVLEKMKLFNYGCCDFSSANKRDLARHVPTIHEGKKP